MSTILPFGDNNITVYSYEPFSYTISNPIGGSSTLSTTRTSGLPPSYLTNNANASITFATTSNAMTPGTQQFTISVVAADASQTLLGTSTNNVTISPGRFVDACGNSFVGSNYTFYAKEAITPINLVAPFNIGTPISTPSLPPGLGFSTVVGNTVSIIGTPLVTAPQSNYLIIGKGVGSGKTVSSTIPIVISNERISTNLAGGNIVSGMQIGTAITPRTLTAKGNGTIRYTWAPLPDGLVMTDISGNVQSFGFIPTDPSYTMILTGTPTLTAANAFKNAGYSNGVTQSISVERTNPLPVISSSVPITYAFGETVLFDTPSNPTVYTNVPLNPTGIYYRAATYFTSNAAITNVFSPDLRSDLSLAFNGTDRAYLTGTPTSAGTGSYTVRAINSNGITRDTTTTISVVNDSVTFTSPPTPAVDVCYNFVLSRPIDLSLNGYYPSPIQFSATAASGRIINWSAPALIGTGVSLSASTGNTVTLVGTPSNITSLQTLGVTASVSSASATQNVKFEVINDVFTFLVSAPLTFIQNKPITPVQFTATALSGRQVTSYSATGLPLGLTMSTTGRLSGTPLSGTSGSFTVTASTGFTNGSQSFSYTTTPDNILLVVSPQSSYPLTLGGPVPSATINGLTYSGANVSNYVFSNLTPTYGLTIDSTTGVFGGTFTTSLPPQDVLPSNVNFNVNANAGTLDGSLAVVINTFNPPSYNWFTSTRSSIGRTTENFNSWSNIYTLPGFVSGLSDYIVRPNDVTSQFILAVSGSTAYYARSLDGTTFTLAQFPFVNTGGDTGNYIGASKIADVPNSSTIYGVGTYLDQDANTNFAAFFKSTDNAGSWTTTYPIPLPGIESPSWPAYLLLDGNAIAYKNSTILLGGTKPFTGAENPTIIYSTNGGNTWEVSSNDFGRTARVFSVEGSRWIAGGSDAFPNVGFWTSSSSPTRTLFYSDDQGVNWSLVASGEFNYITEFIVRGNGLWIAGGREGDIGADTAYFALRYSTDGDTWSTFTLPGTWNPAEPTTLESGLPYNNDYIDSILYDGENYIIVIARYTEGVVSFVIFQHAADGSSLTTGWSTVTNNLVSIVPVDYNRTSGLKGRIVRSTPPIIPTLIFPSQAGNGPTITSPTQTSYLLYQYLPITPIQFSATGTGTTYFFLLSDQLPPGLAFDPVTNQITGTPPQTGQYTVTVYAKNDTGITQFIITFNIILASYIRQQTSAGAWTSLIRQYTEVNAATTARDNKATPAIEYRLGEFTSPDPPSVITATSNCLC